jgi:hypothetical protein
MVCSCGTESLSSAEFLQHLFSIIGTTEMGLSGLYFKIHLEGKIDSIFLIA